jgi:hypothetical protein
MALQRLWPSHLRVAWLRGTNCSGKERDGSAGSAVHILNHRGPQ